MMNGLSRVVDPFLQTSYLTFAANTIPDGLTSAETIVTTGRQLAFEAYPNKALVETDRAQPLVCTDLDQSVFNDNCLNTYFCDQTLTNDWITNDQFGETLIPDSSLTNGSLINGNNDLNQCFTNFETNYNTNLDLTPNINDNYVKEIPKKSANKLTAAKKSRKEYNTSTKSEKSVSAYALFFRDAQSVIKAANPSASFGDISKIVASNWESLENTNKNLYKQRAEQEKKRLLKKRAADRAQEIAGLMAARLGSSDSQTKLNESNSHTNSFNANQQSADSSSYGHNSTTDGQNIVPNNSAQQLQQNMVSARDHNPGAVPKQHCIRAGCSNDAIDSTEWDSEYCSSDCCVKHCADVFQAWVQKQQYSHN